jgi:hypothetical protein
MTIVPIINSNKFSSLLLNNTGIKDRKSKCRGWLVWEAADIGLHPDNKNRVAGPYLSRSWKPLIHSLQETTKFHRKE